MWLFPILRKATVTMQLNPLDLYGPLWLHQFGWEGLHLSVLNASLKVLSHQFDHIHCHVHNV